MFVYLDMLEVISKVSKAVDQYQNFALFPNMSLEMSCLFLFRSTEERFEGSVKLF
jgi:hypothetical protein